eukprot:gene26483-35142_t
MLLHKLLQLMTGIMCLLKGLESFNVALLTLSSYQKRSASVLLFCTAEDESGGDQSKYSLWTNPRYSSSQLQDLWRKNDPLLTVGSKGVQTSHINSLRELLSQHRIVRVKLASDKLDALMISKNFTSDQSLGARSELLEVKTKGILFQRKSS